MPLLELEGVSKTYWRGGRHRVDVLREVSLVVEAGRFVSVVGDPMSGKTTLLRIAAGLERPDAGSVRLEGQGLAPAAPRRRRRRRRQGDGLDARVAIVGRQPIPREMADVPVLELIVAPLLETMKWKVAEREATAALGAFGLDELARSPWPELSDVERTLVRVTQAVARRPRLLLVDDLMRGLGLTHMATVLAALRRTAADAGSGVLMAAGEFGETGGSDEVWQLSAGMLVDGGSRETGQVLDFRAGRGGA